MPVNGEVDHINCEIVVNNYIIIHFLNNGCAARCRDIILREGHLLKQELKLRNQTSYLIQENDGLII